MFRIAICDDNIVNLEEEREMAINCIGLLTGDYQCDTFLSGAELISDANRLSTYNLIILDCEMNQMNGIETARIIRSISQSVIIAFVTNYVDFAPNGYEVEAERYVIKNSPIFEQQFYECIEHAYKKESERSKYITTFLEGSIKVNVRDIIYIQSSNHYFYYYVFGRSIREPLRQRTTMEKVKEQLDDSFVHIHRNYLVNLRFVKMIGNEWAVMDCGEIDKKISIRRGFEKEFQQNWYDYLGKIND